ncbi:MAG: SCO family protein [Anaerolineae bacterium]
MTIQAGYYVCDINLSLFYRFPANVMFWVCLGFAAFHISGCAASSQAGYSSDAYEGTQLDGLAPDIQLTDQNHESITLSEFRGDVVVLTFLDSQCQDVCPLTAAQLRKTHEGLGDVADSVIFLGVNVNEQANTPEDVRFASENWHLSEMKTWHFLTGNAAQLEPIWTSFHIEVSSSTEAAGELVHSPGVYLIDQSGQLRWYISTPFVEPGTPAPSLPLNELLTKHVRELLNNK